MSRKPFLRSARRFAAEAITGIALFVFLVSVSVPIGSAAAPSPGDLVALSASAGEATAALVKAPTTTAASMATVAVPAMRSAGLTAGSLPGHRAGLILLAAVLSAIVAFNLFFFRHLRRVQVRASRSRRTTR